MIRATAIAVLTARMSGAPNLTHYIAWLNSQPTEILTALVEGQPVHVTPRIANETVSCNNSPYLA